MKGLLLAPTRSFVLGHAKYPFPEVLHKGECSLPVCPGDPHPMLCTPGPAPSLSPEAHTTTLLQTKSHTSKTSELELQMPFEKKTKQKTCDTQYFSLHSPWSREVSLLYEPDATLSQPLSLSHFCLSVDRFPSPLQHCCFYLLQFTSTNLTPAVLFPSHCGDPSDSPQIDFLYVPNDLTSIELCLRDKDSPESAYFSVILTPPEARVLIPLLEQETNCETLSQGTG